MMFSVPGVKGIEFGAGFGFADMTGKTANDEFYIEDGKIKNVHQQQRGDKRRHNERDAGGIRRCNEADRVYSSEAEDCGYHKNGEYRDRDNRQTRPVHSSQRRGGHRERDGGRVLDLMLER